VDETFEILGEAALVGSLVEPMGEVFRVFGGEPGVAFGAGEVDDSFGAEDAVKVLVEEDLGETFQEGEVKGHAGLPGSAKAKKRRGEKDNAEAQSARSRAEKDRYPHPRVFCQRVRNTLIARELVKPSFLKSAEGFENKGFISSLFAQKSEKSERVVQE
jgi:hypothetical protein